MTAQVWSSKVNFISLVGAILNCHLLVAPTSYFFTSSAETAKLCIDLAVWDHIYQNSKNDLQGEDNHLSLAE